MTGGEPEKPRRRSMLKSVWIWATIALCVVIWLPLLAIIRMFDRDPVRYRTGMWFRRLGVLITRLNPFWQLRLSGMQVADPHRPYVVVGNHQSMADIPLLAHLPWEMKWVAKQKLFRVPVVGWMMRMAGDIPVSRRDARSGASALLKARRYLERHCSVMFFPEGTRTRDGRVGRFNDGAFRLALRAGVPILPIAVEGSRDCLPRKNWRFGGRTEIRVNILPPIASTGFGRDGAAALRDAARRAIIGQVAAWRGVPECEVDALAHVESKLGKGLCTPLSTNIRRTAGAG